MMSMNSIRKVETELKKYTKTMYDPSVYYPIEGYPPYRISAIGDVKNFSSMKPVQWEFVTPEHIRVNLGGEQVPIERALAFAFLGKIPLTVVVAPGSTSYEFQHVSYNIRPGRGTRRIDADTVALNGVRFRRVPGDERYYVSMNGVLYDTQTRRFRYRKIDERNQGYLAGMTGQERRLEDVVYIAWVGPMPAKRRVRFKDGDSFNCHYKNLDLQNEVVVTEGAIIGDSQFTEEDREVIKDLYNSGDMSIVQLAELYNCPVGNLYRLIQNDGFLTAVSSKLDAAMVKAVQLDRATGMTIRAICDKYKVTAPTIQMALKIDPTTMKPFNEGERTLVKDGRILI